MFVILDSSIIQDNTLKFHARIFKTKASLLLEISSNLSHVYAGYEKNKTVDLIA